MILTDLILDSIEIKNFLSYKEATFSDIKRYNVLIGKNNVGKSNLFKIFEMLLNNYQDKPFSKNYLFNEDEGLKAEIKLIFKISNDLKKRILELLYDGNYLSKSFTHLEGTEGYLKRNEWNRREIAINWLISKGFFINLILKITFSPNVNNLIIDNISIEHKNLQKPQIIFQMIYEKKRYEPYHLNLTAFTARPRNFEHIFSIDTMVKARIGGAVRLKTFVNSKQNGVIKSDIPFLSEIFKEIYNCFFNAIHIIPDKRNFKSDSDRDNIAQTILSPNGDNLVKYIHKKASKHEWDWIRELNEELKVNILNFSELKQDVNDEDRTILILKENGLEMNLLLNNMGAGILNVALFLAYIKELNKDKIICIEEPELHLHPGLEQKLKKKFLAVSNDLQIFLTTHSGGFLDDNDGHSSIYLVQKSGNQSNVNLIPKDNYKVIYDTLEMDIEKYKIQKSLLYNESFWIKFINKAIDKTEGQLWDFKKILNMWHGTPKIKEKAQVDFCEKVASFANTEGGVIIIGITDQIPREIIGIDDLENRKKSIKTTIQKYTNVNYNFVVLQEVSFDANEKTNIKCLILSIAQTKDAIEVRGLNNTYSYPIRVETGLVKVEKSYIQKMKEECPQNNFDFIINLKEFANN